MKKSYAIGLITLTGILLPFAANIVGGLIREFPPFQYFEPEAAILLSALNVFVIGSAVFSYLLLCRINHIILRFLPAIFGYLLLAWIHSRLDISRYPETPLVYPIISLAAAFLIGLIALVILGIHRLTLHFEKPLSGQIANQTAGPKYHALIIAATGLLLPFAGNAIGNISLHRQAPNFDEILLIAGCNAVIVMAALLSFWLLKRNFKIWCYVPTVAGYAFFVFYQIVNYDNNTYQLATIFLSLFSIFLIYGLTLLIVVINWILKTVNQCNNVLPPR